MSENTGSSHRPSHLSSWYTSLPPSRREAESRGRIIITLVAREVTSPDTVVVASHHGSKPHAKCSGRSVNVRKGQKFNLNVNVQPYRDETGYHFPQPIDAVGPPSKLYVRYENTEDLSTLAQTTSNTDVRITVGGGKCQGLVANSWDILNLRHIELSELAFHCTGHYYLYLIIEKEARGYSPEVLAMIRTRKIKVSK